MSDSMFKHPGWKLQGRKLPCATRIRKLGAVLSLIMFFLGAFSLRGVTAEALNQLQDIRFSVNDDNLRVVFNFTSEPKFQSYVTSDYLILDIWGCQNLAAIPEALLPPQGNNLSFAQKPPSALLEYFSMENLDFSRVRIRITPRFKIFSPELKILALKDPYRISVDLPRHYAQTLQIPITSNMQRFWQVQQNQGQYWNINNLRLKSDQVKFTLGLAQNDKRREKTTVMTSRAKAQGGINGGFFARSGGPLGIVFANGTLLSGSVQRRPARTTLGLSDNNTVLMERVDTRNKALVPLEGGDWSRVILALGGGPRLLKDGAICITAPQEALAKGGNDITRRAGRTAVGVFPDKDIMLTTVTGFYSSHKEGMTLEELAAYLQSLGVKDAMCLDGGDSTTMVVLDEIVSRGAGNSLPEKLVADALLVHDAGWEAPAKVEIALPQAQVIAGHEEQVEVRLSATGANGQPFAGVIPLRLKVEAGQIEPLVNLVNGSGTAHWQLPSKSGDYEIQAIVGAASQTRNVIVTPEEPAWLYCRVTEGNNPPVPEFNLESVVLDKFGNVLWGELLDATCSQGQVDFESPQARLESDGLARFRCRGNGIIDLKGKNYTLSLPLKSGIYGFELCKLKESEPK